MESLEAWSRSFGCVPRTHHRTPCSHHLSSTTKQSYPGPERVLPNQERPVEGEGDSFVGCNIPDRVEAEPGNSRTCHDAAGAGQRILLRQSVIGATCSDTIRLTPVSGTKTGRGLHWEGPEGMLKPGAAPKRDSFRSGSARLRL